MDLRGTYGQRHEFFTTALESLGAIPATDDTAHDTD